MKTVRSSTHQHMEKSPSQPVLRLTLREITHQWEAPFNLWVHLHSDLHIFNLIPHQWVGPCKVRVEVSSLIDSIQHRNALNRSTHICTQHSEGFSYLIIMMHWGIPHSMRWHLNVQIIRVCWTQHLDWQGHYWTAGEEWSRRRHLESCSPSHRIGTRRYTLPMVLKDLALVCRNPLHLLCIPSAILDNWRSQAYCRIGILIWNSWICL